jgi:hypothetical protein
MRGHPVDAFDDRILFDEGDPGIAICRAASDAARSKS